MNQTSAARPAHKQSNVRASSRPSAARAAAAARLVGSVAPAAPFDPKRLGEDVRHLRVVEAPTLTPAERRRRARLLLTGGVGLALAVVFGLVYMHVVLAQRQFAIDHLNTQVAKEQASYQSLRLQVAQLGSPQNIISTAEGQLGMVQPGSVTYLTPSTRVGAAAPAGTAAQGAPGQAPAGDADWPQIKSQLAGSP